MAILVSLIQKTFIPYQGSGLLCTFFVQETSVQFCLREFRRIRRPKMSELNARAWHCFEKRNALVKHILLSFQRTWLCTYRTYQSCARNNFFFFFPWACAWVIRWVCACYPHPQRVSGKNFCCFTGHRTSTFSRRSHSWAVGVTGGSWLQ